MSGGILVLHDDYHFAHVLGWRTLNDELEDYGRWSICYGVDHKTLTDEACLVPSQETMRRLGACVPFPFHSLYLRNEGVSALGLMETLSVGQGLGGLVSLPDYIHLVGHENVVMALVKLLTLIDPRALTQSSAASYAALHSPVSSLGVLPEPQGAG